MKKLDILLLSTLTMDVKLGISGSFLMKRCQTVV